MFSSTGWLALVTISKISAVNKVNNIRNFDKGTTTVNKTKIRFLAKTNSPAGQT